MGIRMTHETINIVSTRINARSDDKDNNIVFFQKYGNHRKNINTI